MKWIAVVPPKGQHASRRVSARGQFGKGAFDVQSGVGEGGVEIVEEVALVGESVECSDGAECA
jgi:hypothetical protein